MKAALLVALLVLAPATQGQDVPALTGRVVDTAEILSPAVEAALTERLAAFEDSTTTQVVVLTVPSLGGAVLEEFATRVFRAWGIGQEGRDNGALLLVARDDRAVRIEVGYGLEGDLTDARSATIIRTDIVPHFRGGDYDAGVLAGTEAILASVSGTYAEVVEVPPLELPGWAWWIILPLFGVFFPSLPLALILWTNLAGAKGTVLVGVIGVFMGGFMSIPFALALQSRLGLLPLVVAPVLAMALDVFLERHPVYGAARRARRRKAAILADAQRRGQRTVLVDGVSHAVPSRSSGSSSSSSGSSFSGGGGSSGGGGASGSW